MSEEIYIDHYLDTLNLNQRNLLCDLFSFKIKIITLDFDQIMVDTETPVKQKFYQDTGVDYRDWKIDRWLALATHAATEGKMAFEEAAKIEEGIWRDRFVLKQVKPIRAVQAYSKMAYLHGVKQSVVTSREPDLRQITLDGINKYFNWIPESDVHIRSDDSINGDIFKGKTVGLVAPDLHLDDSVGSTRTILEHSNASVMLFSRSMERNQFMGNERVLEFPNMSMLLSLLR